MAGPLEARFTRVLASKPRIILGTSSSSRRAVMDQLAQAFGFSYEVKKADIDEKAIRHDSPSQLVMALAHAKADAIIARLQAEAGPSSSGGGGGGEVGGVPATLLITCDQVVVHEGRILEKPEDAAEARAFIAGYARSPASTVGSVLCTRLEPGGGGGGGGLSVSRLVGVVETCTILMDPLPGDAVDALIEEGEVMWCAGGLMAEHPLVRPLVRGIQGGGEDSVMGLGRAAAMRVICDAAGGE